MMRLENPASRTTSRSAATGFLPHVIAIGLAVSGCWTSTTARLRTDDAGSVSFQIVDPAVVIVSPLMDIGRPYDIVGVVIAASSTGEQPAQTVELLRHEAAALGADAVVDTRLEIEQGYYAFAVKLSGMAVKRR